MGDAGGQLADGGQSLGDGQPPFEAGPGGDVLDGQDRPDGLGTFIAGQGDAANVQQTLRLRLGQPQGQVSPRGGG